MKNINTFKLISDYESEKSGALNTPNVSFVAEDNSVIYLLENTFENGHEYVDLGLPSGLKWATCNVGASNPQDYGLYFAWGETKGYTAEQVVVGERKFDENTYHKGSAFSISYDLRLKQDAANVNMGGKWRMPTKTEFMELYNSNYTTTTWTSNYEGTGVAGRIITSKTNGNSIFLPPASKYNGSSIRDVGSHGDYWSSTYDLSAAWQLIFDSGGINITNLSRAYGLSVRGVCK